MNEIYEQILNDNEIIERYKEVEQYELSHGGWAYHNFNHVCNVRDIVVTVLNEY